ncbi:MAG TPA: type II secretion system protein [Candidatus Krumholzibacteria bacterium]|nr:type II secretion system protein [Candidatus Krumholzibacteria bacterium]
MEAMFRRLRSLVIDDRTGFSVVEMLIVFTIVGIAMIPMAAIQFSSRREVAQADRMSRATELAVSQLELIKLDGFAAAVPETLVVDDYTVVTTAVPDSTNPFLREVAVRVEWPAPGGTRDVTMAAMQSAMR